MRKLTELENLPSSEFRQALSSARRVALIAHTDMDGLAAVRALQHSSFRSKLSTLATTDSADRSVSAADETRLLADPADLLLFLDIAPGNLPQLERLLAGRRGIVVDHHKPKNWAQIPALDDRFHTYKLYAQTPDIYSIGFFLPELLGPELEGESYDFSFTAAALFGDNNFRYFENRFEAAPGELVLAARMGQTYKHLGTLHPRGPAYEQDATRIRELTERMALEAPSLGALDQALVQDPFARRILEETEKDAHDVLEQAVSFVAARAKEPNLFFEFVPKTGFFATGFIYQLEARIRAEQPGFRGILVISQEGQDFWRFDGLSTDPARSAGELFARARLGGGHHNAGGGQLPKSSGKTARQWFEGALG